MYHNCYNTQFKRPLSDLSSIIHIQSFLTLFCWFKCLRLMLKINQIVYLLVDSLIGPLIFYVYLFLIMWEKLIVNNFFFFKTGIAWHFVQNQFLPVQPMFQVTGKIYLPLCLQTLRTINFMMQKPNMVCFRYVFLFIV